MNRLALTAVLALTAACTASTLPPGDDVRLDFEARRDDQGQYRPQPVVTAAGGPGEIVVDARLSAPSPCQQLTAAGFRDGRTLELEVRVASVGQACVAVIGNFAYTARVQGLERGVYTLRVRHLYPGTGWTSGTVLETQVTVG